MTAATAVYLPAQPLLKAVELQGEVPVLSQLGGRLAKSFYRARRSGHLTVWAADELAVHGLGQHPALVWGDAWWDPPAPAAVPPLAVDLAAMHRAYRRRRR